MVHDHAARSTLQVVQAGRDLRAALGDPDRLAEAAQRLADTAETTIARLDRVAVTSVVPGVGQVPEDAAELLAATLSQLGVAGTMFAASDAVGEQGPAEPSALDEPLRRLDATVSLLIQPLPPTPQGIVAAARSASVPEAVAALEKQLARTVDDIVARSTKVIGGSLSGIHDKGPQAVREAWDMINEKLHLDQIGGKLAKLGLRAFRAALAMLSRIVPAAWLTSVRERVDRLIASVDKGGPGKAVVGIVLGADALAEPTRLDQSTLDTERLDKATADLAELAAKYGRLMDLCGGVATAVGLASKLTVVLRLAVPQLGILIMAAHVLVVGGVVTLGRDHIDAGVDEPDDGRGMVHGVRSIVAAAQKIS